MKRVLLAFFIALLCSTPARAAVKLEVSPADRQAGNPRIVWKLTGLGRLSAEAVAGPDGCLYLPLGGKLGKVAPDGRLVWAVPSPPGGKTGRPVFAGGSLFAPGKSSLQEVKPNGARGWDFAVYQGSSGSSSALLAKGPQDLLCLPVAPVLYAVDTTGRYRWSLRQWELADTTLAGLPGDREILACTGSARAFYVVYGKQGEGHWLAAVDGKETLLWRFWLGDLKVVHLTVGNGRLFVVAGPRRLDESNKGKVYAFRDGGAGWPEWVCSVDSNELSEPALSSGKTLYFSDGKEERLFAISAADGKLEWDFPLSKLASPPAVDQATGLVFAGSSDGLLFAVSPEGRSVWRLKLDGAITKQPLAGLDGCLYVFTDRGSLYEIKTGE